MVSYLTLLPLCKGFARMSTINGLYITVAYVFANFIDADKRIKGIQIRDHEIKLVNFADGITFFLADITCLNRIHMI